MQHVSRHPFFDYANDEDDYNDDDYDDDNMTTMTHLHKEARLPHSPLQSVPTAKGDGRLTDCDSSLTSHHHL